VFSNDGPVSVTPGVPVYDITSPVFDRVTINCQWQNIFPSSAGIIRKTTNTSRASNSMGIAITGLDYHADIVNGGTLELQMGNTPNQELGSIRAIFARRQ